MLTKWTLSNFKSFRDNTEVVLGPLTVFAGANSSGKSTLIQSILLVSQTLASKMQSRSVILNGHLTKLGQFDDLRSFGSQSAGITIGFECTPTKQTTRSTPNRSGLSSRLQMHNQITRIGCEVSFDVSNDTNSQELLQLQPQLHSCKLTCEIKRNSLQNKSSADIKPTFVSTLDVYRTREIKTETQIYRKSNNKFTNNSRNREINENDDINNCFEIVLDPDSLEELHQTSGLTSFELENCRFRHFLPDGFSVVYDEREEDARFIASMICSTDGTGFRNMIVRHTSSGNITSFMYSPILGNNPRVIYNTQIDPDTIIPKGVIKLLSDLFKDDFLKIIKTKKSKTNPTGLLDTMTISAWMQNVSQPRNRIIRSKLQEAEKELSPQIENIIRSENKESYGLLTVDLPTHLSFATDLLDQFFSTSIKYLGPLRDDPKPVYPLATTTDPSDIGSKGEHTAAVLELHKNLNIQYIPSNNFTVQNVDKEIHNCALKVAVLDWLRYFGIAEGVETPDQGKLGHGLQVITFGDPTPQDLTHVGVGVSQVLPIVVMCLLAEKGTTIIIEQPELHLHPFVQSRLADFFLSMALLGKQCLVETHSEYIINRLRLRVASAPKDSFSSLLKTYFAEKNDFSSSFREVVISKYGAINDWPKGFFDQSQHELEQLLRTGMAKRKLDKQEGKDVQPAN